MASQPLFERSDQPDEIESAASPDRRAAAKDAERAQGLYTEIVRLERALAANPRDADAIARTAEYCTRAGYPAEAAALFMQAMMIEPARAGAIIGMAELLSSQGLHGDAAELLHKAIEQAPQNAALWHAIGSVMVARQDSGHARMFFDEALRLEPAFNRCRLDRAALHQRCNRLAEALADYTYLRRVEPSDPGVLVGWGDVRALMGARDDARIAYTAALGLAGERWVVEDRLQRLAIMDFDRPLPRADLPPAAETTPAPGTTGPLNLVIFHADIPQATVSPFEKPDYHAILAQTVAVARSNAPGARIVLLSDETTPFAADLPVDRIVRRPLQWSRLMYERMRMERDFLASPDCGGDTVFLDSDVVVDHDPRMAFDGSFDVCLMWRLNPYDAPFNGGVALYRNTPAALKFYDNLIATHDELERFPAVVARFPDGMAQWWGHQLAMAATVGWTAFAMRRSDRMSVDGTVVRFLPESDVHSGNAGPEKSASTPRQLFTHFKGTRKAALASYASRLLNGSEPPRPPAIVRSGAASTPAVDPGYTTYDLGVAPISYDVCTFLALAHNRGVKHVDIVPGPHSGFRDDGWYQKADVSEKHFRLWNLIVPACQLAGMTVTVHRDRAKAAATRYRPEQLYVEGVTEDVFHASVHAKRWVREWLRRRGLERPVVVNLRESHWPSRDSNMDAWRRFAVETNAVVVPDTEGFTAFGHVFDAINMDRRLALYEEASVVTGVNNGPLGLCWFSVSIPYLVFKMVSDYPASTAESYARRGLPVGSQHKWSGPHQRFVWEDDDYDIIRRAYDEFLATAANR
jgi:tetratricopeptide (TPR) repeat protein